MFPEEPSISIIQLIMCYLYAVTLDFSFFSFLFFLRVCCSPERIRFRRRDSFSSNSLLQWELGSMIGIGSRFIRYIFFAFFFFSSNKLLAFHLKVVIFLSLILYTSVEALVLLLLS